MYYVSSLSYRLNPLSLLRYRRARHVEELAPLLRRTCESNDQVFSTRPVRGLCSLLRYLHPRRLKNKILGWNYRKKGKLLVVRKDILRDGIAINE